MTDRYDVWQQALIQRDHTLVVLTVIAVSLVAAWCLADYLPERTRGYVKQAYLWSGIPLYLLTLYACFVSGIK